MKVGRLLAFSLAVCAAMLAFAFYAAAKVPADTQLATHWDLAGEVDATMPALQALLFPAGLALLLSIVFSVLPRIEPLQDRLDGSAPLLRTAWIGTLLMMVVVQVAIGAEAFGYEVKGHHILFAVGPLLMFIGNKLPKSRPGFLVGIRTPWTIVDEDIWIATHRLGGKLMMLAGTALIVLALAPLSPQWRGPAVLATILLSVFVPVIWSWWLWYSGTRMARRTD